MKNISIVALIMGFSAIAPMVYGRTQNPVGAWKGPNDLMINLCDDGQNKLYVCHCGIFRTYGWINFSITVTADSLVMMSTDSGSPFDGRFKIESDDNLAGSLTMGNPDDPRYYNGNAQLVRQTPEMPDNLNPELKGIILPTDYSILSLDRQIAQDVLKTVMPSSYGYDEKRSVEKLLNARTYPISPVDMIGFKRVRSIQIDARDGIFSYPYFRCLFSESAGKVFFEKITGSQRKSGYIYQNTPESLIFL